MAQQDEWVTIVAPEIISLNDTTQVRVEVTQSPPDESGNTRKGFTIRQYFRGTKEKTGPDKLKVGPWKPTKKGVWIPLDKRGLGNELVQAVMTVWANYQAKLQETL